MVKVIDQVSKEGNEAMIKLCDWKKRSRYWLLCSERTLAVSNKRIMAL